MNRINLYLFSQILNSCTLVFFIFVSIAWLLQLSRLFNIMSNLQISPINILYLSILIIPNLISITLPFILIFGFVLAFIKFSKDKEIIAIFSLGLSINEIKKPIILIIILFTLSSVGLSFILSPNTYNIYKKNEHELRNSIKIDKINLSNFIKFNENLTIDFENENGIFKNILINIKEKNDVIIYAKNGKIEQEKNKIIFKLNNGFKIEIDDNSIESLKFDSYLSDFAIDEVKKYNKFDSNALNIFELLEDKNNSRNKTIIYHRIIDTLILVSISILFYFNIITKNNYKLKNLILFIILTIICLTIDNLLENFTFKNNYMIIFSIINIFLIHVFQLILNYSKINE